MEIKLKWTEKKQNGGRIVLDSSGSGQRPVESSCENTSEPHVSKKKCEGSV
jgi:hypothetical protein